MALIANTASRAPRSLGPCACRSFEFGQFEPEVDTDYGTDCTESTKRTFAQGHDAKLVGFLVRAELAGDEIRVNRDGVIHSFQGAVHAAASISEALADKAEKMLASRVAKAAAKANKRLPRKAAPVEVPAEIVPDEAPVEVEAVIEQAEQNTAFNTQREATIKVGRWTYDAVIDFVTGDATYRGKLRGEAKTAPAGTFTEVN